MDIRLSPHCSEGEEQKSACTAAAGRLTVVVFTASPWRSACPVLRIHAPAKYGGLRVLAGNIGEKAYLDRIAHADVVIIQRDFPRYRHAFHGVTTIARRHGIPLIYECDDLLHDLPEDHPDNAYYLEAWLPIMRAIVEADAVTTTTVPLGEHYRLINPNTRVLPNYIDPDLWPVHRVLKAGDRLPVIIGYMGTHTHVPDLLEITPALVSVLNQNLGKVRLHVWGPQPCPLLLNRPDVHWEPLGLVDYHEFADFFCKQSCDIFVAPLCDNEFNRCKSQLKFLEYSILGVPGIYGRVVPYQDIVIHGHNGLLASDPEEWRQHLERLIKDPALRVQMGMHAQQTVREHWLISGHAALWRDFYHDLSARKRQPAEQTTTRRLLKGLGLSLKRLEQELEQKDLVNQLLIHTLDELQRR
jgi:glycosyltransferase involved in cell wall biosynthesis